MAELQVIFLVELGVGQLGARGALDGAVDEAGASEDGVRRGTVKALAVLAELTEDVWIRDRVVERDGRAVQVLEISGPQVDRVRLLIDQQMLIIGQAYTTPSPLGAQSPGILNEEVFSDYRFVNGIRVPFETQLLQNGQPVIKRTITKVSFNETVPDNLFNRPS